MATLELTVTDQEGNNRLSQDANNKTKPDVALSAISISQSSLNQSDYFKSLNGKFIRLKNPDNGDSVIYQIDAITSEQLQDVNELPDLVKQSTNRWLFTCNKSDDNNTKQCRNFSVALIVILLQILAYITLAYYLISGNNSDKKNREENCYGSNCKETEQKCMFISVGSVTAFLLIGFLLADIINSCIMLQNSFNKWRLVNISLFIASMVILVELFVAIACGVLVGIYTDSKFDVINGAVGVLFVHELDEKIYAAMDVIGNNWKRILALLLWIVLSLGVALPCACIYTNNFWLEGSEGLCKIGEFKCGDGTCIWYGYVCNGVRDCIDGEDEQYVSSLEMTCDYSLINCPENTFMCKSTGTCIDLKKQCDGFIDCDDASDEQWDSELNGDDKFGCHSDGICIDKSKQCNNVRDCIDGSDELFTDDLWNADEKFMCKTSGICIDKNKRCNGISDCPDGSDEDREQHCSEEIAEIQCNAKGSPQFKTKYNDTDWYLTVLDGKFKCQNGQCIDAKYMCDGVAGDCVDRSDEYPYFSTLSDWPFRRECPYARLIECDTDEVLCKISGHCISKMRLCDGYTDCPDGQDELSCDQKVPNWVWWPNCPGWPGIDFFYCGSPIAFINDTHYVLFENDTTLAYTDRWDVFASIYDDIWAARDVRCLPWEYKCDGIMDCADGSDEQLCRHYQCEEDQYQCKNGECIPNSWKCDGLPDCLEEDDEVECANGTTNKVVLCNEPVTGSITSDIPMDVAFVYIPCPFKAAQFTLCSNATTALNTKLRVIDANVGTVWYNDDTLNTDWVCAINPFASTVTINQDEFKCDEVYMIQITGKYLKESYGNFGLQVICSNTDF